jgi:hypothetical protein
MIKASRDTVSSPDRFVVNPRVFESEFKATYHIFGTVAIPTTVTKSMGLLADLPTGRQARRCHANPDTDGLPERPKMKVHY